MTTTTRFRALLSFHYYRTADLSALLATRVGGEPPDLFADSGAYSAWTQGVTIELDDYCRWLEHHEGAFTTYANLDVIGDYEATARNQETMEERGLTPLPVFHTTDPWPELERLCQRYAYVGLGGAVGFPTAARMPWLVRCFKVGRPYGTRFHGFGVTTMSALLALPFYSVDSSSWGSGFRYGQVNVWDPKARAMVAFSVGTPEAARYGRLIRSYGFDPRDFEDRERYTRTTAVGLAAVSWAKMEEYLQRRNGPALEAYLADGSGPTEPTPRVYLAETGSPANPMKIANALQVYLAIARPGRQPPEETIVANALRIYLADGSLANIADAAASVAS